MLIHSIAPMQMLSEPDPILPTEIRNIPGGYIEVCKTSTGFTMSRLFTTDPAMYLMDDYSPGTHIK